MWKCTTVYQYLDGLLILGCELLPGVYRVVFVDCCEHLVLKMNAINIKQMIVYHTQPFLKGGKEGRAKGN